MNFENFIQSAMKNIRQEVGRDAGSLFVEAAYNGLASEIVIIWANEKTASSEIYVFPVIGPEELAEYMAAGRDILACLHQLVSHIRRAMWVIQNGHPPCGERGDPGRFCAREAANLPGGGPQSPE
ncbi:hypothetical protein [Shimwellia blattae]|uniref:Uncharacterized protein n=1 Tax=Shimwellia blattae (strain ATCC 29907 / DSM 4481 / JCM 1650 / NBRC 105725 / CDC 9005-74) TaxID=630626 RepID=I2BDA2_SHIBC|nr:hypothetical protein [Shimwellia blattae]AFJ48506.1 hypothetical protein EBL_c34500 [Shimwellia blattae DSM 4481 = NBRC 105725]GAB83100.1 hypothetical protein EB105725_44_00100 [Shimwellia blattae DSM 4481 = NBRC 105725]VDY65998.1 Uncharacterised protein [Shimwellia blattae]VEC26585.1 Uncharacterised protein [Shimwellia blattae]